MSAFLHEVGLYCFRHHRRVTALWLALLVVLGLGAGTLGGKWKDEFDIPGAASQAALTKLNMTFPQAAALRATALVQLPEGHQITDPDIKQALTKGADEFSAIGFVAGTTLPWDEHVSGLIADNQRVGIMQLQLDAVMEDMTDARRQQLVDASARLATELPAGSRVDMGGEAFSVTVPTMTITEALGVVVALVVLAFTLGSVLAAGLPIVTALTGVGATTLIMLLFARLTPIMSTTPMLAVMLGLAVGIDYALFILSRHREQLATGMELAESAARSVATAGSAVVFAGLTVMIALVGLGLGGVPFLTVMGLFAAVGVAFAVVIALTMLPALMGFLGERMRPGKPSRPRRGPSAAARQERAFGWWARTTTRHPWLTILLVVLAVAALSWPARGLSLSLPNSGQNELGTPARTTYDTIAENFGPGANGPLIVTADLLTTTDPMGVMNGLKADIEKLPGVASVPVAVPNPNADTGFVQVVPTTGPDDPATKDVVNALLAEHDAWQAKYGVTTGVTGSTAIQIDITAQLTRALLPFGIFVVGLSLVLLTMVFRSIAVPIKATLGYLFSIGVAFGVTTLVFNHGWLRQLVNLERPMPVISFLPILLMGILFGLAMDYEVFLVSRIREEYVHGKGAREAIQAGFVGAGPVVAAAAVIMFSVFAFFVPEGDGPIKSIAFSLAVGVAVDAFVVRMTLVPAVMHLLGEKAWWLPGWLDRLLPSLDVEGEGLQEQMKLADWPANAEARPVHAEGIVVDGLFGPLDVDLPRGSFAVVTGEVRSRSALVLALSGRLRLGAGRARVGGALLPLQAAKVRSNTAHLDLMTSADRLGDLRKLAARQASARAARVVFVDGVEPSNSQRETEALAELVALARSHDQVVVFGAIDRLAARQLEPDLVIDAQAKQNTQNQNTPAGAVTTPDELEGAL